MSRIPIEKRLERYAVDPDSGCWRWLGKHDKDGYGRLKMAKRGTLKRAHRVAYELWVGPIPEGLVIDHVLAWGCVHRDCINPAHMEPVSHGDNVRRGGNGTKTHCKRGHEFTPENTRRFVRDGSPRRVCRTCSKEAARLWREAIAEAAV